MKRLIKFLSLPRSDKRLVLEICGYLINRNIAIRTRRLPALLQRANDQKIGAPEEKRQHVTPRTICRYLEEAGRIIPRSTCLSMALVGQVIFFRYGYVTQLHIGVRKNSPPTVKAHAWLSLNGEIILGNTPEIVKYSEFPLMGRGIIS